MMKMINNASSARRTFGTTASPGKIRASGQMPRRLRVCSIRTCLVTHRYVWSRHPQPEGDTTPFGSDYAVEPIARVSQAGNDVADVVETGVHPGQDNLNRGVVPD